MPDFVTLGETCAVFVGKNGGPLRYSMEFERRVGGAETTVAVGVARLGHQAGWISRLGDDEFGNYILGVMRSEDVDVSTVKRSSAAQTGVFFRENRAAGRSSVFYYRQNSAFSKFLPEELDEDYIASAKIFHLTGITPGLSPSCRETTNRAIDIAKGNNVTVVFDPNYRSKVWLPEEARPYMEQFMRRADHVLAGYEDLTKLTGILDEKDQLSYLHGLDQSDVVLKTGRHGVLYSTKEGLEKISSHLVDRPIDRFGVGDSFAVGYIVGLLEGSPVRECIRLGNAVAGWAIRLPGNIEALPTREDLRQLQDGQEFVTR